MNKRGLNHIEIMLSFLIFMGFVVFALYFFSPFRTSSLVETSMDYAFREIIKNTTVEIETRTFWLNATGFESDIKKIEIKNIPNEKKVIAENKKGIPVPVKREGLSVNFNVNLSKVFDTDPNKGFAIFKFSEEFSESSITGGGQLSSDKYKEISSDQLELPSEKRFISLNSSFYADYESLKKHFNFPGRANFEFTLRFDSTDFIEAKRKIPEGIEIYTDMKRIEVLRADGTTKFADLIVRVW